MQQFLQQKSSARQIYSRPELVNATSSLKLQSLNTAPLFKPVFVIFNEITHANYKLHTQFVQQYCSWSFIM